METPSAVEARQTGGEADLGACSGEEIGPRGLPWPVLAADNHDDSGIGRFDLQKGGARVTHTSEVEIDAGTVKGLGERKRFVGPWLLSCYLSLRKVEL